MNFTMHVYRIAGIFRRGGGKIFVVFMVERRTTKIFTHETVLQSTGCGLVYCAHENFSTNWPKIHCSRKFYPPKNTRYTVYRQWE